MKEIAEYLVKHRLNWVAVNCGFTTYLRTFYLEVVELGMKLSGQQVDKDKVLTTLELSDEKLFATHPPLTNAIAAAYKFLNSEAGLPFVQAKRENLS